MVLIKLNQILGLILKKKQTKIHCRLTYKSAAATEATEATKITDSHHYEADQY